MNSHQILWSQCANNVCRLAQAAGHGIFHPNELVSEGSTARAVGPAHEALGLAWGCRLVCLQLEHTLQAITGLHGHRLSSHTKAPSLHHPSGLKQTAKVP